MVERWWTFLIFACFCILGFCGVQLSKKPLCIDSKVVEKIDRVSAAQIESIYRCGINKPVPFSAYFDRHLHALSQRIENIEHVLETAKPFKRKIRITIFESHPFLFYVRNNRIYIGEKLLESGMHLEKALAKLWYKEVVSQRIYSWELLEEVVTDFLIFLPSGKIKFASSDKNYFESFSSKWPHVIKNAKEYCESPWKKSEHYSFCSRSKIIASVLPEEINQNNLRSLLSMSFINAYKDLSLKERKTFVNLLQTVLSQAYLEKPPSFLSFQSAKSEPASTGMREATEKLASFTSNSSAMVKTNLFKIFSLNFRQQLVKSGFPLFSEPTLFDALYVVNEPLDSDNSLIGRFSRMAEQNSNLLVAIKDNNNLWLLPSKHPTSIKSFGAIHAHTVIVEHCGNFTVKQVSAYESIAEKLLIIDNCLHQSVDYSYLLTQGVEEFAAKNQGITFVQFHLPSLMMKKINLKEDAKVLNLNNREFELSYAKNLEWQQVHWNKKANAYQPKSSVEAIQWYRFSN